MPTTHPLSHDRFNRLNHFFENIRWGPVVLGILSMIGGVLALTYTFLASLISVAFFATVLFLLGVALVVHAFQFRKWYKTLGHALIGVLWILAAIGLWAFPTVGLLTTTILLAALFIVSGIFKISFALWLKYSRWGWTVASGVGSLLLAAIIFWQWPLSSFYIPGLLLGIDLIFYGAALTSLGSLGPSF